MGVLEAFSYVPPSVCMQLYWPSHLSVCLAGYECTFICLGLSVCPGMSICLGFSVWLLINLSEPVELCKGYPNEMLLKIVGLGCAVHFGEMVSLTVITPQLLSFYSL